MDTSSQMYDVVVVGGGIVGISAAVGLATKCPQLRIALVDAAPAIAGGVPVSQAGKACFDPRVVALTQQSQRFLQMLEVWRYVDSLRVCAYTDMRVWDAEGTGSVHFDANAIGQESLGCIVENSNVVQALNQRLAALPNVQVVYGARVKALHSVAHSSERELVFENGNVIRAGLIVAADGAQSKLRELCGLPTREWNYGHSAIVTTVTHSQHHEFTAWQRFLSTGPLAFLPLIAAADEHQTGFQSSIVWSAETLLAEELMTLPEAEFNTRLSRAFEERLGTVVQSDQRFMFPLRQRHVKQYFTDGVVFIGDAAHTIHPLAGQGANLGLGDAEVLVDEVARAVQRSLSVGELATLRRYQRRRKDNNLLMMGAMEGFKQLFAQDNLTVRWLRNTGMSVIDRMPIVKNTLARRAMGI